MKINSWNLALFVILTSCSNNHEQPVTDKSFEKKSGYVEQTGIQPIKKQSISDKKWFLTDFYTDNRELKELVDSIFQSLSDAEKAAQMIMAATSEYEGIGLTFKTVLGLYRNRIIGSVLFLKGRRTVFTNQINILNKTSQANNILPAVFACDCEPSLFHKKFTDADPLPPASDLNNIAEVQKVAATISLEMKRMGLHWNFAPVADINTNQEIINNRSFGNNFNEVVEKSSAFIQTSTEHNITTTLKHFPGHGSVRGDSHNNLVFIDSQLAEINNFTSIIRNANPVSVMVGHIAIKNNQGFNTSGMPATLSKRIVSDLLKDSLGFRGIVVTDAMNMGAVKNIEDADFKAVLAGNDIVLIPEQAKSLHKRIIALLKSNDKTRKRISASVKRIIRLKICLGLLNY